MSATPPPAERPDAPEPREPRDATFAAVSEVSLRLLAGAVPPRTIVQLQHALQQTPSEYPWQTVTQAVLAEPVDPQQLVQKGLAAQRDWIVRGGRETPRAPMSHKVKGFFARLCAQLIFGAIYASVIFAALLLLKYKIDFDIYRVIPWLEQLPWIQSLLGRG